MFVSREFERSSPPRVRANSTALSRTNSSVRSRWQRCPHLDEVTQVFDVFTHVGDACTLFKIVLVLHFARIRDLPENSQHRENVHRPDDGMLRGLPGARKSEVHPEPLHLRPFQSSGWDTSHLQLEFVLNLSQSTRTHSRRSDTEAVNVQETLLWRKRDVQGQSPLSSRAPLVRIQEQTRKADARIQRDGLAPRMSLTKTSRSTTYQRLGTKLKVREYANGCGCTWRSPPRAPSSAKT